jgi:hypothetical protein
VFGEWRAGARTQPEGGGDGEEEPPETDEEENEA